MIQNLANRIFNWYFSKRALPYWCVLFCDSFIIFFSLILVEIINNGLFAPESNPLKLCLSMLAYMVCYLMGFRFFRTYSGVLRYSSFVDLYRVTAAVTFGSILVELLRICTHIDEYLTVLSFSEVFYASVLSILLMSFLRVAMKLAFDLHHVGQQAQNAMIVGTREGGVSIAKSIRNQSPSPYKVKGFLTNLPDMAGHTLMNRPVFMLDDPILIDFIEQNNVNFILVSPLVQEYFINTCQDFISRVIAKGVKLMMMGAEQEWDGKSELTHASLHEVSIEELLPRKKIEVDMETIGTMLQGQRILITGAAGSIGSEMVRQVATFKPEELILVDQAETPMHDIRLMLARQFPEVKAQTIVTSITNETHMEKLFQEHRPQYVFHAAAYKHVPMMEDNPSLAVQNNVYGTRVIADCAVKYGTKKFVMISTDKAVNPTNVMGCSKRICEIYCQSLNQEIFGNPDTKLRQADGSPAVTQFVTTRFGNVLGSNGSVIPIFKAQIRKGGPVTVTHPDIIRFFMLIPEACRLVLEAGTIGHGGEIFVFDMGEPVRIVDLAQRMIDLMGAKTCKIVFSGLRDGEKLFEEVLNDAEQTKPTRHPKIKVAAVREYPYAAALQNEIDLHELSYTYDDMKIVAKMKEIVPEYKSRHSKYEVLDK